MKYYCPLPFNHIYNNTAGNYNVCCYCRTSSSQSKELQEYTINNTMPFDFFFSKEMNHIRKNMIEGNKQKICEPCYVEEEQTSTSPRLEKLKIHGEKYNNLKINLKLRIFGDYCNLSCYMCYPLNSTTRRKELIEIQEPENVWQLDQQHTVNTKQFNKLKKHIYEHSELINDLQILGGEPLQSKRLYEFLLEYPNNDPTILIQTNFTKLGVGGYHIDNLFEKFNIYLQISLEHFGAKQNWIRYNSNYKTIEKNIIKYKKHISNFHVTISILNVDDLFDIEEYYKNKFNLEMVNYALQSPKMLSIRNHPNKSSLYKKYKNTKFENIFVELNKDPYDINSLKNYLKKLSIKRGNYKELWPSLI